MYSILVKKYSTLEFQGVFLRSFGQTYGVLGGSTPGTLHLVPSFSFPTSGSSGSWRGLTYLQIMEFAGPNSAQVHPLTPASQLLLGHPGSVYTILVSPGDGGPWGGGIGRHRKWLRAIWTGNFKAFHSQSMARVEDGYRYLWGTSPLSPREGIRLEECQSEDPSELCIL